MEREERIHRLISTIGGSRISDRPNYILFSGEGWGAAWPGGNSITSDTGPFMVHLVWENSSQQIPHTQPRHFKALDCGSSKGGVSEGREGQWMY